MKCRILIVFAAVSLLLGCGDSPRSGSDSGVDIGPLSGQYKLDEGCTINASGARATTRGCQLEKYVDWPLEIDADAKFLEDEISFEGTADEHISTSCHEVTCQIEASGTFYKQSGRQENGPFEAFAGEWSGSLHVERVCENIQVVGPADNCEPVDDFTESDDITVGAQIFGMRIDAYSDQGGSFTVTKSGDNLIIDGDSIPIE